MSENENVIPCICGTHPVKEMRRVMLGKLADGGYSVFGGCWDKNIAVWNKFIQKQEAKAHG